MSGEGKVFDKEFKLMSVEPSGPPRGNTSTDLSAFGKIIGCPASDAILLVKSKYSGQEIIIGY